MLSLKMRLSSGHWRVWSVCEWLQIVRAGRLREHLFDQNRQFLIYVMSYILIVHISDTLWSAAYGQSPLATPKKYIMYIENVRFNVNWKWK